MIHMLQDQDGLFDVDTPLMFADGTDLYDKFAKDYMKHKEGYFILGPSGIGKSYFVRRQKTGEKHWIDADVLWRKARAMPIGKWWEKGYKDIERVEEQCDIVTAQAKHEGLWLIGSSCRWLIPDAVVVPHWSTNVRYIKIRDKNYDGGITAEQLPQLLRHRKEILGWAKKGVPKFTSVEAATKHFQNLYEKENK